MTCYVQEKKRDLFSVTVFEGKAQFSASPKIGKVMEDHPDVMELLKGVFQKQLAVEKDDLEEPELKVFGDVSLPLLLAPFMKIKKVKVFEENSYMFLKFCCFKKDHSIIILRIFLK